MDGSVVAHGRPCKRAAATVDPNHQPRIKIKGTFIFRILFKKESKRCGGKKNFRLYLYIIEDNKKIFCLFYLILLAI